MPTSQERKPKIFIASSSRAIPTAEALKLKLDDIAEVKPWWRSFRLGDLTLKRLLELAAECDFAAVLLTEDDMTKIGDNEEERFPRDNCIFELGLFIGALGLEPKRAFILSSVKEKALPNDLRGLTRLEIHELGESSDEVAKERFNKNIDDAIDLIKENIKEYNFCYKRPVLEVMPTDDLMQLEKPTGEGGNLIRTTGVEVIVHSTQPIEKNHEVARRVQQNMEDEVSYNYFFQAEESNINLLAPVIRTLAAAQLNVEDPANPNRKYWAQAMIATPDAQTTVYRSLENMKNHLRIFLLEHKARASVQFCIHNASHDAYAICYLRYSSDLFVKWCRKEHAKGMADGLKFMRPPGPYKHIFHGSLEYDLYNDANKEFREQLRDAIMDLFPPEFHSHVKAVCFGNKI